MLRHNLARLHCAPGSAATRKFTAAQIRDYRRDVPGWKVKGGKLVRGFTFADFSGSMGFVKKMATLANQQQHHPDFAVHWNKVEVTVFTHSLRGLSLNDFILAAKISRLAGYRYV